MCGGDGTAMCGEPRVATECTYAEREVGRCSRPTVRPGRNVNDERDHGDGSSTRPRGRCSWPPSPATAVPASLARVDVGAAPPNGLRGATRAIGRPWRRFARTDETQQRSVIACEAMKRRSSARIGVNVRDPDHRGDVVDNRLLITVPTQGLLIWNDLSTPSCISVSAPIRGTPREWRSSGSCDG